MTDMEQALTISGAIFGAMMLTQFGRRHFSWHKVLMPILTVVGVGWFYLKAMPTDGVDWAVYGVGAAIGLVFGVITTVTTGVGRDALGRAFTRCGLGFVAAWLSLIAIRVAFIALADHNDAFREHLGSFMFEHGIVEDAIAPFFVVMALVTVLSRVALVSLRIRRTPMAAVTAERELVAA